MSLFIDIEYKPESFRDFDGNKVEHFFSNNKFRLSLATDPNQLEMQLSICSTCNILRPPRSFHCRTCNVCVENQDHHCPWMGTCIGKRNLVYFISFLFLTSFHAGIVFATTLALFLKEGKDFESLPDGVVRTLSVGNTAIMIYCATIGFTLLFFGLYTTCLMLNNTTSNENLRTRWNAARD